MRLFIELFVRDLSVSVRFYQDVVGLDLVRLQNDFAELRAAAVEVHLVPVEDLPEVLAGAEDHRLAARVELGLEVVNEKILAALRDRVVAANWELESDIQRRPWGKTDFRIVGPEGEYLRFSTPHDATTESGQSVF